MLVVTGVIYKIEIKQYRLIGSTINFKKRKNSYLSNLRRGVHPNPPLQRIFNKYGESFFKMKIIVSDIPRSILLDVESIYIGATCSKLKDRKNGLNIRDGVGPGKMSEEKKKHYSKLFKKMYVDNPELKYKFSKTIYQYNRNTGIFIRSWKSVKDAAAFLKVNPSLVSESARKTDLGKPKTAANFLFSYVKKDFIKSYSKSKSKAYLHIGRTIYQYNLDGLLINQYLSVKKAGRQLKVSHVSLKACALKNKNDLKFSSHGYKWSYKKIQKYESNLPRK